MKKQLECKVDQYGTKYWYLNDELHREDGPAIEHPSPVGLPEKAKITEIEIRVTSTPVKATTRKLKARWTPKAEQDFHAFHSRLPGHYYLHGKQVHPEQLVDYHLSRGTFCYYDKEADELRFE